MEGVRRSRRSQSHDIDYQEPSSNDGLGFSSADESGSPRRKTLRPRKRKRQQSSLSSFTSSQPAETASHTNKTTRPKIRKRAARVSRRQRKLDPKKITAKTAASDDIDDALSLAVQPPKVIPPWRTLPWHVLEEIFWHAAGPISDWEGARLCGTGCNYGWLLGVSSLCKAFYEAAMPVLYHSPPIHSGQHGFMQHFYDPASPAIRSNNGSKIRHIFAFVGDLVGAENRNKNRIDLSQLIKATPNLRSVDILSPMEMTTPEYHHTILPAAGQTNRWMYPSSIFEALESNKIRLNHWRWSAEMLSPLKNFANMPKFAPFRSLKSLALAHFAAPTGQTASIERFGVDQDQVIEAINGLQYLDHLEFKSCSVVNDDFLLQIDKNLETLKLCNCDNLQSTMLSSYLLLKGSRIKKLILDRNNILDLDFLEILSNATPRLEKLRIDMQNESSAIYDGPPWDRPEFNKALSPESTPSWPDSLRRVEIYSIRNWEKEDAERLLNSLVNAAPQIKALHTLKIVANLDLPVRERAGFRNKWVPLIDKTFKRPKEPVDPRLRSIKTWYAHKARQEQDLQNGFSTQNSGQSGSGLQQNGVSTEKRDQSGSGRSRFSVRIPRSSKRVSSSSNSKQAMNGPSKEGMDGSSKPTGTGTCEIVQVFITNTSQRPDKWTEADFLDSERSGDESWSEGNDEPWSMGVDPIYAKWNP